MSGGSDQRIVGQAERAARVMLGIALLVVVLLNVANAGGRYLAGLSITGIDELMVYLMIWIVMAGAALSLLLRAHIAIDLVPVSLSGSPRRLGALRVVHDAVALAACGFAALASWSFAGRIAGLGTTSMGLGIPMIWAHAALVAGFGAMTLAAGWLLLRDLAAVVGPVRGRAS
jgi:TRAP-type C4-dicarboxylate transport system permease small subunit